MATKTVVVRVDDLTGNPADTTVTFAIDHTEYEIDLSENNAGELLALRAGGSKGLRKRWPPWRATEARLLRF
jgi:Lsr2